MRTHHLVFAFCLFFILGTSRIFTLSAHWSSDESLWLRRSAQFIEAVQAGQFEQTLLAYHPGVTTMWLSGFRTFFLADLTSHRLSDLAYARWFIGIAVLGGLAAAAILLHRLFEFWQAICTWSFISVSPFLLAQSRRVHTDALATIFIFLTVLLFLCYCVSFQKRRFVVLSGIAFGLACLSKSYALILLLWFPLCLWLFRPNNTASRMLLSNAFEIGLLFFNSTFLTIFVVWPLFWNPISVLLGTCLLGFIAFLPYALKPKRYTKPILGVNAFVLIACTGYALKTVWLVFNKVNWAVTTPHNVEHFFFGKIVADPGPLFYPLVISIKSTPLTVPLAIFGVILLWKQRKDTHRQGNWFRIAFSMICGVLPFILCLSLTAKKFGRYLLPVFPMIDMLAGLGLFCFLKWVGSRFKAVLVQQAGQIVCVVLVFVLTLLPVFALHPYYGIYHNLYWKATDLTKITTVGDGSGLDIAAKYLNQKPDAHQMTVQVSTLSAGLFQYYFIGSVYQLPPKHAKEPTSPPPVEYEVVYIRDSQIGWIPQEGTRGGNLEHVITLNGIDRVWIYRVR